MALVRSAPKEKEGGVDWAVAFNAVCFHCAELEGTVHERSVPHARATCQHRRPNNRVHNCTRHTWKNDSDRHEAIC